MTESVTVVEALNSKKVMEEGIAQIVDNYEKHTGLVVDTIEVRDHSVIPLGTSRAVYYKDIHCGVSL